MAAFRFLEFFAGVGMARLGLGESWQCIWANDISPRKAEIYCANHGSDHFHLGDVAEIRDIPLDADMAWASFPCQDLSLAGWRRGMNAGRSGAFWPFWEHMSRLMQQGHRPPMIVIENVVGLIHSPDFSGLCESLLALGMQFGALIIDALHFLPQSRPRVFIVAVDMNVPVEDFVDLEPVHSIWFPESLQTVKASLPEHVQAAWRWWKVSVPDVQPPRVEEIIEAEPTGVRWNSDEETQRLLDMMTARNRAKVDEALAQGGLRVGFLYKRVRQGIQRAEVRFDGVAGCLRTPTGGSSRQTVVIVQNGTVRTRLLSPREAARLMGVPDTFWLPDAYNHAYEAMGDGVAVPVVAWLSEQLLLPLVETCQQYGRLARGGQGTARRREIVESHRVVERIAEQWRAREYEEIGR
jgi:DNA (cytosine-5)-methyltransferase 1